METQSPHHTCSVPRPLGQRRWALVVQANVSVNGFTSRLQKQTRTRPRACQPACAQRAHKEIGST